ncbi:mandelate racemase/muconate lactonizing enzyme family protein [Poseidonocella sp. HB161398]|uniref:L-talarate/galactarate dehydratase n=1 Tax=Poseidonocella sp. HB161398 TaxID=2320855 RepID=UPI001109A3B0|nr:mandelate racemase/muconate lactonizing enzyme family protein [Poseidonocella sp. HB161398]
MTRAERIAVTKFDRITGLRLSHVVQPIAKPVSDAKVATGRQTPLAGVDLLIVEIVSDQGITGMGFSYTLRAGGTALLALAREIGPLLLDEDPNRISWLWEKLAWRTNSLGEGGAAAQCIAAFDAALWDLKAKRAGLPLAHLLGAHREAVPVYNTSGQYLQATIPEMRDGAEAAIARGIGGIKMKVGQPDRAEDMRRIAALREVTGGRVALMVDANQQWSRPQAASFCREIDDLGLAFIEEPLAARDHEGHGALAATLATPVATGEMLTSVAEHRQLIRAGGCGFTQVDAPRIGGITPFLKVMALAEEARIGLAPHFVMEQHIHLAAAYSGEVWVEHFDWFEPLFEERLAIAEGCIHIPDAPGFGLTLSGAARAATKDTHVIGSMPGL